MAWDRYKSPSLTVCELAQLGEEGAEDVEGAEAVNACVVDGGQQIVVDGSTAPHSVKF